MICKVKNVKRAMRNVIIFCVCYLIMEIKFWIFKVSKKKTRL